MHKKHMLIAHTYLHLHLFDEAPLLMIQLPVLHYKFLDHLIFITGLFLPGYLSTSRVLMPILWLFCFKYWSRWLLFRLIFDCVNSQASLSTHDLHFFSFSSRWLLDQLWLPATIIKNIPVLPTFFSLFLLYIQHPFFDFKTTIQLPSLKFPSINQSFSTLISDSLFLMPWLFPISLAYPTITTFPFSSF